MRQINSPVSIIVPTLNEAANLQLLFKRTDESMSKASIPYEIIVVDDNSTDETARLALTAEAKYNVSLLIKQGEPGKAFSLLEGFQAANYDLVCMIDADLQYPPEEIPTMYKKLQRSPADIIVTERIDNKTGFLRRLSSFVFNLLFVRMLFGINYDTQSGLKLFKKRVLGDISLSPSPWSFDLEFIVRSLEQGYTIGEHKIPFGERYGGVPKVKILSATIELIKTSVSLRRQIASKRVRFSYNRNIYMLQRGSSWLIALVATAIIASVLSLGTANAASSPSPKQIAKKALSSFSPAVSIPAVPTATTNPTTTPASSSSSTPSAPQAAISTSTPHTTPASSTASITSTSSTSTPASSAAKVSTAVTSSSSSIPAGDKTTNQSKNAAYYNPSKLSTTATQKFLKLALAMLDAGGIFILLGIIGLALRPMSKKPSQLLRS